MELLKQIKIYKDNYFIVINVFKVLKRNSFIVRLFNVHFSPTIWGYKNITHVFFHLFLLLKIKCKIKLLNETASKRFLCFTSNKINSRYTVRWRIREESPVTNSNAPVRTVA